MAGREPTRAAGASAVLAAAGDRYAVCMPRMPRALEELVAALVGTTCLGVVVAVAYWLITGLSPWPGLVLGEVIGFGWGAALLAMSAPRSRD